MGKSIDAWGDVIEKSLRELFSGKDDSIKILWSLISDGQFIEGGGNQIPTLPKPKTDNATDMGDSGMPEYDKSATKLRGSIAKNFFAFAIPTIWTVSGRHPFIIDSGYLCSDRDKKPMDDFLDNDTMDSSSGCYDDRLYYIAQPKGEPWFCIPTGCVDEKFSALPGIDVMGSDSDYGNITVGDIIEG